jgi:hypothetical protein
VDIRHASSAAQLTALPAGKLDVALIRKCPADPDYDAVLAVGETLGCAPHDQSGQRTRGPAGIWLRQLVGPQWLSFPRAIR